MPNKGPKYLQVVLMIHYLVISVFHLQKSNQELVIQSCLNIVEALFHSTTRSLMHKSSTRGKEMYKEISMDEWHWVPPKAGYLSFPRYDLEISSWDLCITLHKETYQTYLFPGSLYGFENHLRLGWGGTKTEEIKAGLEQLEKFMETL